MVLIVVGMLNNLNDLLLSGPDEYSDLTGMELVAQKVKLCTVMGGQYPSGREWNLLNHPQAAQLIAGGAPCPCCGAVLRSETPSSQATGRPGTAWKRTALWPCPMTCT